LGRGHEKYGSDGARGSVTATGKGLRSGTIGLTGSVVIAVSLVAPAYPLAAVLAGMLAVVGAKTHALFVIGFVPMLLTAFAFRELARQTPDCGSTFTWATRTFGPWVGRLAGWAAFIAAAVAVAGPAWLAVRAYPVARAEFEADARRRAEQAIALIRRADQQHALVMARRRRRGVYGPYPPSLAPS
jgi:hypothetical protein